MIYPVDSVIHLSNNRGLLYNNINQFLKRICDIYTFLRLPFRRYSSSHCFFLVYVVYRIWFISTTSCSQDSVKLRNVDLRTFCCPLPITRLSVCVIGVSKGNGREESCRDKMVVMFGGHQFLHPRTHICSGLYVGFQSFRHGRDTTREWENISLLHEFDSVIKIVGNDRKGIFHPRITLSLRPSFPCFYLPFSFSIKGHRSYIRLVKPFTADDLAPRVPCSVRSGQTHFTRRQILPKMPLINVSLKREEGWILWSSPVMNFSKILRFIFCRFKKWRQRSRKRFAMKRHATSG